MNTPPTLDDSGDLDDGPPTDHQLENSRNRHDDTDASPDDENYGEDSIPHKNIASATENDHLLPPDFEMYEVQPLTDEQKRHRIAFYQSALTLFANQGSNNAMMTKDQYQDILYVCHQIQNGTPLNTLRHEGFPSVHFWNKKYAILREGNAGKTYILLERPKQKIVKDRPKKKQRKSKRKRSSKRDSDDDDDEEDVEENEDGNDPSVDMDHLRRATFLERLYADLLHLHEDHNKSNALLKKVKERYCNVAREWVQIFTKTCPGCIERAPKMKPLAGLRNIITMGFGVRGQCDIIDLQSMADGAFKYLLNYIDHGVKLLFSVPLTSKRASAIALALYHIFCTIGPPMILQTDNGREFSGAATSSKQRRSDELSDGADNMFESEISEELLGEVITEIRKLWPECRMVTGTPRHSESNGGVERVNRTVQQKLHAWMKMNNSTRWSIGCSKVAWQVNTQYHETIKNVPYVLTFGQRPRIGISNLPVDPSILDSLHTEAELNMVANFNPVGDNPVIETPVIDRTSRPFNPDNETPAIDTPVVETPAVETQCSLEPSIIDNLESYTGDFAVENIEDNHDKEPPKERAGKEKMPLLLSQWR